MSKFTTEDQASHPSVTPPSAGRLTWYSLGGEAYVKNDVGTVTSLAAPSGPAGGALAGTYPNPTIAPGAVSNADLASMAANTVKANPTGALAAPQDVALPANSVLGRVGGNIVAAKVATAQVADNAITNANAADMASQTIKGRGTTGVGDPEDLTPAEARAILGVAAGANNYTHPNHTGDVTSVGDGAQTIVNDAVTNAKLANMATQTIKGRTTAGTGDPQDLTAAQATAILNLFTAALQGLVPASSGGAVNFLRADGVWAAPGLSGLARKATPGPFATTNTAPTVADTFAPGAGLTGTFRLGFRCEFNSNTAGSDVVLEVRRTDVGPSRIAYNEEEPVDGNDWNTFSHFEYFVLAGATPTFDLRINRVGAATVRARRIQWEWWKA